MIVFFEVFKIFNKLIYYSFDSRDWILSNLPYGSLGFPSIFVRNNTDMYQSFLKEFFFDTVYLVTTEIYKFAGNF